MKNSGKIQAILLGIGLVLTSGFSFPQAASAQRPLEALTERMITYQGVVYPVIRSLPVILDRTGGVAARGNIITTDSSSDGRYELVELIGDMSSPSIFSYTGRTAFRQARVKDTVTGDTMEALVPLMVRYF
ncbi:hypothetical protein [Laspinema olomoucense]|uniref:Uncharacterized protein n=1 Tax=Laspinema olomoucense D3b TaxID=2953688 RepID=A0ABT2N6B5_9CYAN|nr:MULTISPECIES: hypothetical protein [unclassified Laspinema]MCT7972729.1 hypothetical protein [Laspinema sp. D3d]MCT7978235.1 hypothetical protein [Laspinema sp. D3b]MCT7988308.1 hypothetical protein [Laspinema sp. D3a]MCT7995802.1 hypothetical protein [Laspinema sp. D3c]